MIRVALVDDHEIVRRGVADLLEATAGIEVVAEAGTVAQGLARITATRPDVAVLDMRLPDGNGIDLCRELRSRMDGIRCVILTAYDDDDAVVAAVIAGASGYLLKDVRGPSLVEAITAVAAGRSLLHPAAAKKVSERVRSESRDDPRFGSLNIRERQILGLITDGLTNRQIGERLGLKEKTVKNYASNMLRKLGLERRTQAAVLGSAHRDEL
ncbi:response regulator transcription factor [Herbiconiux sp. VKM Ac-1786]|uniref:response regulator n=1 Tax=Herbiconiux sp. VKM Ac-1786 TaxID=2783824 RepID=UPI00188DB590|nr:response regulator transcription factor [Herbiconiux sp. VKM Ac-1786]MBF4571959.1 response regulator transcription factor [Herbiconiux sp. VKM Ac-1786]